MNPRVIATLVGKDLSLFFRNRFFAIVTLLGLIFYVAVFLAMPQSVDETLKIGLYAPVLPASFQQVGKKGLEFHLFDSEESLKKAVTDGTFIGGVVFPADLMERLASGLMVKVNMYFAPDTPTETKSAVEALLRELLQVQAGQLPVIAITEEILGPDLLGMQIPPRNRLRPLFGIFIIMFETFGLANLISEEVERRTVHALLVTPTTVKELFLAKGISGTSLAFSQAVLFMGIAGGLRGQPLVILTALLLGSVLVTGVAFLMAALSKDMLSVMAWGVVVFIIFLIPSFGVLIPGLVSGWVKVIPSHYLVNTLHLASNFGAGWSELWSSLLMLLGFALLANLVGVLALERKWS